MRAELNPFWSLSHCSRPVYEDWLCIAGGTITLADGQRLQYDWLVLALGSSTTFFGIPGVKDLALPFNDFKDAMRVGHTSSSLALWSVVCWNCTNELLKHQESCRVLHVPACVIVWCLLCLVSGAMAAT